MKELKPVALGFEEIKELLGPDLMDCINEVCENMAESCLKDLSSLKMHDEKIDELETTILGSMTAAIAIYIANKEC
jgi:hypothetical protein